MLEENEKKERMGSIYVKFDNSGKVMDVFAFNIPENYVFKAKDTRANGTASYYICANRAILNERDFQDIKREALDFHSDLPISFTKLEKICMSSVPLKKIKPELESLVISRINAWFNCSDISISKRNALLKMAEKATFREYFIIENYLMRTF